MLRLSALHAKYAAPQDGLPAVEAVSPSSVTEDRLVKPLHCARAGIPHDWRLEPDDPVLLTQALAGAGYVETGRFTDLVEITDPVTLTFDLADLLR